MNTTHIHCWQCCHWKPVNWNNTGYTDIVARCDSKDRHTTRNESCFNAARTLTAAQPVKAVRKKIKGVVFSDGTGSILPLKHHQLLAVTKHAEKKFAPIFFEAGVGKTATSLRIVKHQYDQGLVDSLLVIAPNKVHTQWFSQQIPMWLADTEYSMQIFGGHQGRKSIDHTTRSGLNILVTNINNFSLPDKWKEIVDWTAEKKLYIILDEATVIKNVDSKRTQRLLSVFDRIKRKGRAIIQRDLTTVGRAILTGTPVTNNIIDIWSMMEFLVPNYWNRNYYSFQNRYCMMQTLVTDYGTIKIPLTEESWGGIQSCGSYQAAYDRYGVTEDTWVTVMSQDHYMGPNKHMEEIKERLHSDSSFCKLQDCEDIKDAIEIKRIVPMGEEQQRVYDDMDERMVAEYGKGECTVQNKLVLYLRLQQIANGFVPIFHKEDEDDYVTKEITWFPDVPKLDALYQDVEGLEKPLIISTRFTCEAERIFEDLCKKKYKVCLQTGWKTVGSIEDYQAGKYDIMVANIRVVSKGFNLQNGYTILRYSNTYSLEDKIQLEGRVKRIGQTKACQYIDYISENTLDMKVIAALRQRREVMDYITSKSVQEFLREWDGVAEEEYGQLYFDL